MLYIGLKLSNLLHLGAFLQYKSIFLFKNILIIAK